MRWKIFFLILVCSGSVLGGYAYFVLRQFSKDRLAYAFEATGFESRLLKERVEAELRSVDRALAAALSRFDPRKFTFSEGASVAAELNGARLCRLPAGEEACSEAIDFQGRPQPQDLSALSCREGLARRERALCFQEPLEKSVYLRKLELDGAAFRVLIEVPLQERVLEELRTPTRSILSLQDASGQRLWSSRSAGAEMPSMELLISEGAEGRDSTRVVSEKGRDWIVSEAGLLGGDFVLLSLLPHSVAFEGQKLLIWRSIGFIGVLFFLTVAVSIFVSSRMVTALEKLVNATDEIAKGNFDIHIEKTSGDEIGTLSEAVDVMRKKIHVLLDESVEKARMQVELKTAQAVQATLFPSSVYDDPRVSLRGSYESMTECGGDWWFWFRHDRKFYVMIGDATGHGVSAALVTSAARATVATFENRSDFSLPELMSSLNHAIHRVSKGAVNMTFQVAVIDLADLKLSICNASHVPPLIFRRSSEGFREVDVFFSALHVGPIAGMSESSVYRESVFPLQPGDRLLFLTDGLPDVVNPAGKAMGERRLLSAFLKVLESSDSADAVAEGLRKKVESYRAGSPLVDDVTWFYLEIHA